MARRSISAHDEHGYTLSSYSTRRSTKEDGRKTNFASTVRYNRSRGGKSELADRPTRVAQATTNTALRLKTLSGDTEVSRHRPSRAFNISIFPFLGIYKRGSESQKDSSCLPIKSRLKWHVVSGDRELSNHIMLSLNEHSRSLNEGRDYPGRIARLAAIARSQLDPKDWRLALSMYSSFYTDDIATQLEEEMNRSRRANGLQELKFWWIEDEKAKKALHRKLVATRRSGVPTFDDISADYEYITQEDCERAASQRPWMRASAVRVRSTLSRKE